MIQEEYEKIKKELRKETCEKFLHNLKEDSKKAFYKIVDQYYAQLPKWGIPWSESNEQPTLVVQLSDELFCRKDYDERDDEWDYRFIKGNPMQMPPFYWITGNVILPNQSIIDKSLKFIDNRIQAEEEIHLMPGWNLIRYKPNDYYGKEFTQGSLKAVCQKLNQMTSFKTSLRYYHRQPSDSELREIKVYDGQKWHDISFCAKRISRLRFDRHVFYVRR